MHNLKMILVARVSLLCSKQLLTFTLVVTVADVCLLLNLKGECLGCVKG